MENSLKTSITRITPEQVLVRGYDLAELIGQLSYAQAVFLILTGRLPSAAAGRMLDAILVASIDHGVDAPSTPVARTAASCGVPVQAAISAGISAIGEYHGGAGEQCARILQEAAAAQAGRPAAELARELVRASRESGQRLPGFGHRMHNPDPRSQRLLALAQELGLCGAHVQLARAIENELLAASGRALPLNVDGAMAAILSDLGIDWRFGKSLFIIARTAGLAAQVHEQMTTAKPLKFAAPLQAEYCGPAYRPFPSEPEP